MLTTKAIACERGSVESHFTLAHHNPASVLELDFTIRTDFRVITPSGQPQQTLRMSIDEKLVEGDTEAALDKLAEWFERGAAALRARNAPSAQVPIY